MAKSKPEPEVAAIPSPAIPELSPEQIRQALAAGGLQGLINVYMAKIPNLDALAGDAIRKVIKADNCRSLHNTHTSYRLGNGAPDHAAVLRDMERHVIALKIGAAAAEAAYAFVASNPGVVVHEGTTKRRTFPVPVTT